mgnify:CR=1 FL=1
MIVKPTVNELLQHVENRYALVIAASRRAREIAKGDSPLTKTEEKSPVTIAANEIVEGKVSVIEQEKNEVEVSEENQGE